MLGAPNLLDSDWTADLLPFHRLIIETRIITRDTDDILFVKIFYVYQMIHLFVKSKKRAVIYKFFKIFVWFPFFQILLKYQFSKERTASN